MGQSENHHEKVSRGSTGAFVFLCLIVFLLPIPLGSNRVWAWATIASLIGLLFSYCCLMLGLNRWVLPSWFVKYKWFLLAHLLWLASTAWYVLPIPNLIATADSYASVLILLQSLAWGALVLIGLILIDTHQRIKQFLGLIFLAGSLQALYGVGMTLSGIEYGFLEPKQWLQGLATGTFINRNHFAGFLELTFAAGLGLLIAQLGGATSSTWRERIRNILVLLLGPKTLIRAGLALIVVGLVMSQSRLGNIGLFASLGIVGVLSLWLIRPLPKNLMILMVSLLILDFVVLGSWVGVSKLATRIQETSIVSRAAAEKTSSGSTEIERIDVSQSTLKIWRDHMIFGTGPGTFRTVFPAYKPDEVIGFYDHAHNDWAQVLAERGAVGFSLWIFLLISGLVPAVNALRKRHNPLSRGAAIASLMGCTALLIHAFGDFNLQIPSNLAYFNLLLMLALPASFLPSIRQKKNRNHASEKTS